MKSEVFIPRDTYEFVIIHNTFMYNVKLLLEYKIIGITKIVLIYVLSTSRRPLLTYFFEVPGDSYNLYILTNKI